MSIRDMIEGKREWRAHVARVKALPQDYQIVYKEIQKYLFKIGIAMQSDWQAAFSGLMELFEDGAASGKGVLEVTGSNVADFCDELIKDSKTYADVIQETVDREVTKAIKKSSDKSGKGDQTNV